MTTGGWFFMIGSLLFVLALTAYCFIKVLAGGPGAADHLHSPVDIDTKDLNT